MTSTATIERSRTGSTVARQRRNRTGGPGRGALAAIGAIASVVLIIIGGLLVASGAGVLSRDPQVNATVPAEAGLIQGAAGVQYQGVHVGSVIGIDAGVASSRLTMQLGEDGIAEIPASVVARIVPRTLFGDVFIELVPPENPEIGPRLSDGAEVVFDTSDEAVQLADLYYRAADMLEQLRPEQLSIALDAVSQALEGRGEALGVTIDRMAALTEDLGPLVDTGIAAAPQMAAVAESMSAATDDVITVMQNASELSRIALEHEDGIARLLSGGAALGTQGADLLSANTDNMIAVVRNGAPVVGAFAGNTEGLDATLKNVGIFGEAGARVFSTGRFNITAIADFADPMPYTSADCPRYPGMEGSNCGDPVQTSATSRRQVVSGVAESAPLGFLEQISAGIDPADPAALLHDPSTAASVLLGPLVRGAAVSIP